MTLEGLRQVRRSIAICGGKEKFPAILGAVRGQWINTLVTDHTYRATFGQSANGQGHCSLTSWLGDPSSWL